MTPSHTPLFWENRGKEIPPRPDFPESYPWEDERHWYDREYAGWMVKKEPQPPSPPGGPKGKEVMALVPGDHPYSREYQEGMREKAESYGIALTILDCQWDSDLQDQQMERVLRLKPDLIILWAEDQENAGAMIRKAYSAGIPLIASNFTPDEKDYPYILSWTGPDDWEQFRLLSRRFASLMNNRGGYGIICHREETSSYYARSWAAITELNKGAPAMELLEMASTDLDSRKTCDTIRGWLSVHGPALKGIICADDSEAQEGINQALEEACRSDVICVANGSTPRGIRFIREGKLKAITYQDPRRDGALAVQVCADYFHGLAISGMNPLPVHLLDRDNILDLVAPREKKNSTPDYLYQLIMECRREEVSGYFRQLAEDFSRDSSVTMDYFRGFTMEILSNLMNITRTLELPLEEYLGRPENLFKKLFLQPGMDETLGWLREVSLEILRSQEQKRKNSTTLIEQVIAYAAENYHTPLSLKVLAYHFNLSSPYLGRLFKKETGDSFPLWLNRLRLEKAEELMMRESLPLSQIALKVGYANANYFFNLYKKYRGMNPGDYLESLRDNYKN